MSRKPSQQTRAAGKVAARDAKFWRNQARNESRQSHRDLMNRHASKLEQQANRSR